MADREAELGRDLLQRKFPAEIGLQPFACAPHLPRSKTAASRSACPQSAIGLRDVRGERKHHVIDEKLVGLGRPTQRLQKRRADMTDDLVVMADAELTGEFTNARRAGLLGDAVERRARKIEMEGVERLLDDEARIVLHVVQICCARSDIQP